MKNKNKKYGYILSSKSVNKNENKKTIPMAYSFNEIYQNEFLLNQPNINENKKNLENLDSDIDDPKYKPNFLIDNNRNKNILKDENYNNNFHNKSVENNFMNYNKINDDYLNKEQNNMSKSRFHNFENIENFDFSKENFIQNKSILDVQNENELLKQEILKKSEIIRTKDELITEFQNIYNDLKIKFQQYESKNAQLRQQIKFLESQIQNNQNIINNNNITNPEINEKTISLFKQQISELESNYDTKIKKIIEKFKDKENKTNQDHIEEISRLNKNIENMRSENSKLKTEISNNKIETDSLKAKLDSKDYEKKTYLEQKENEIIKLKEKIYEQDRDIEFKEKELKQRISKLEDQISLLKQENNNLLNKISESKEKSNEYDSHLIDNKNTINRLNSELNQIKFNIQNKDALIEQLKKQIDELNNLIVQSEEDMKLFEENKQEEFKEYTNQIEILMEEKNILTAQNIELTNNLALANENMKQLNEIIIDKYADVEAELFKQTNINENMEKKYKNVLKHMKDKQNCLNQENIKLKEIINNEQDEIDENYRENEVKINDIQNSNLINKMNTSKNNYSKLNFESQVGTNRSLNNNNKSNLININENSEQTFRNNNMNIKNNYNYNINSSYIDTKEAGQKRTLDNFRMLLDKMDKKIN